MSAPRRLASAGLLCVLAPLGATGAQGPPTGYYDTVDTTDASSLRATLHAVIDDHQRFPYTSSSTDTWDILEDADEDPNNASRILDVYRNASFPKFGGGNPNYDREHTWPSSYGFPNDGGSNYPYSDCHQLMLCAGPYNSSRGNKPFRNCDSACDEWTTDVNDGMGGGSGTYAGNSNWTSGFGTNGTWETWIGRRGDVARALLYLDVRYEGGSHSFTGASEPDLILTDEQSLITASSTGSNESVAYMGLLSVLLEWHEDDPVDQRERDRNDVVFSYQNNRNPFVDNPQWVDILWGDGGTGGPQPAGDPWINEFHYDNSGGDVGEFVEVAGPAGFDLSGYRLVGYNGSGGGEYNAQTLSGTIPDEGNCLGALSFSFTGLQNGGPDGIALVDNLNQVVEFLSYEGTILATDGPADGMTSTDVGVEESSSTPIGQSLQRIGSGTSAGDFTWTGPASDSPGTVNGGQTFLDACVTQFEPYGCGVNPADSLVVLSGTPALGDTLTLGVDNPLGTQATFSLSFVTVAGSPDPAFPCGTPLPGFGMAAPGAVGELLVAVTPPNPLAIVAGPPWIGAGNPSPVALPIPSTPALSGVKVYCQGTLFDLFGTSGITFGLTTGLEVTLGS